MSYLHGADAAFAGNIPPGFEIAFGYYGGPNAFHVWSDKDWGLFPGRKVPIWVGGFSGVSEGESAAQALRDLGVPRGSITVLDLEGRVDKTYVEHFGASVHNAGYKVWVYGEADTVFSNPQLNGYWVAHYTGVPHMEGHPGTRATQYAANLPPGFDASLVKSWCGESMWR